MLSTVLLSLLLPLCRASVVVAIPCPKPGPRVISGLTVGFSPRGKEVVCTHLLESLLTRVAFFSTSTAVQFLCPALIFGFLW
jgi:hypothetical protein